MEGKTIYQKVRAIKDPKERCFAAVDAIKELQEKKAFGLYTEHDDIIVGNLKVIQDDAYNEWKY